MEDCLDYNHTQRRTYTDDITGVHEKAKAKVRRLLLVQTKTLKQIADELPDHNPVSLIELATAYLMSLPNESEELRIYLFETQISYTDIDSFIIAKSEKQAKLILTEQLLQNTFSGYVCRGYVKPKNYLPSFIEPSATARQRLNELLGSSPKEVPYFVNLAFSDLHSSPTHIGTVILASYSKA